VEPDSNPFTNFAVDSNNMVDENSLLSSDKFSINQPAKVEGCATKVKACKNCSCGRKEDEYFLFISYQG